MDTAYKVVVAPGAEEEIRQIHNYLLEEATEQVAEKVRLGIEEEIRKLASNPESKGLLKGTTGKTEYRRVLKWSYRIIFSIVEKGMQVRVVRVDHSKSNPIKLKDLA